jgi:hypothetical protein
MLKRNSFALQKYLQPIPLRCEFGSSKKIEILLISLFTGNKNLFFFFLKGFFLHRD